VAQAAKFMSIATTKKISWNPARGRLLLGMFFAPRRLHSTLRDGRAGGQEDTEPLVTARHSLGVTEREGNACWRET